MKNELCCVIYKTQYRQLLHVKAVTFRNCVVLRYNLDTRAQLRATFWEAKLILGTPDTVQHP